MKKLFCFLCTLLLILSSCTVTQNIFINAEGGGTYSGDVSVSKDFADYLSELASLSMDSSEEFVLFKTEDIRRDLEEEGNGVAVTKLKALDEHTLHIELDYKSIETLVQSDEARASGIIRFEKRTDGAKTVRIHLDRQNYTQLNSLFSDEQSIVMDTFGPEENEGLAEEEYLEMMSFALGEKGPDLIRASIIETRIDVAGRIIEQKGGVQEGNTVIFRIPLIRILLLDQALDYTLTFR